MEEPDDWGTLRHSATVLKGLKAADRRAVHGRPQRGRGCGFAARARKAANCMSRTQE